MIYVVWDEDTDTYSAVNDDDPGLVTEAENISELMEKLGVVVSDPVFH